MMPTYISY